MSREIVSTSQAPGSALYSQAVKAGGFVYLSGLVGIDPATGALAGESIQQQVRQSLTNCQAVLEAAGCSLDDVIEVGVLLTRSEDFDGLTEEYVRWFPSGPPARYVARLGVDLPGLLVSIRMTAYRENTD